MCYKILSVLSLAAFLSFPCNARAQVFNPDFDCSKSDPNDSIQQLLCHNNDAAMAELSFDQSYYALRHIVGKSGWKKLKQEAISDDAVFAECISILSDGSSIADPDCYIKNMDILTQKYTSRLSGSALEEATRPLLEHRALQQKLSDLGFLSAKAPADAVYGESTRVAIETWQRVAHRPAVDGFISNDDASVLLNSVKENTPDKDNNTDSISAGRGLYSNTNDANHISTEYIHNDRIDTSEYLKWINIAGWVVFFGAIYLMPTLVAIKRGVHKMSAPVIVNVVFGWTLIGWVIALIMASSMERGVDYELRTRAMIQMLNK